MSHRISGATLFVMATSQAAAELARADIWRLLIRDETCETRFISVMATSRAAAEQLLSYQKSAPGSEIASEGGKRKRIGYKKSET